MEKKLKDLEVKEAELEKKAHIEIQKKQAVPNINLNAKITQSGGIDSGNDHNYCSDTSAMTSPPTTGRQSTNQMSADDLKRVEYQQMILKMMNEKKSKIPYIIINLMLFRIKIIIPF